MIKDYTNLFIALILILPGTYLLWYANGHVVFYQERRWEKWKPWTRAYFLGILFNRISRYGGSNSVRHSFRLFAILCIAMGLWAMSFAI